MNDGQLICPTCHAIRDPQDQRCWLCKKPFDSQVTSPGPILSAAREPAPVTFTITSIMIVTTLVAVCVGLFNVAPGLGILLCILSLPAMLRATFVLSRKRREGVQTDTWQKFLVFLSALGGVILAGVTAVAVFYGTCAIACFTSGSLDGLGKSLQLLLPIGALLGLFCGFMVMRALWRRRQR